MIATTQVKKILSALITTALRRGEEPNMRAILTALHERVPELGQPTFQPITARQLDAVNIDSYNAAWNALRDDLVILYEQVYQEVSRVAQLAESSFLWSLALQGQREELARGITECDLTPATVDQWREPFSAWRTLDASATTAHLDFSAGMALLPIDPSGQSIIPLTGAAINGRAVLGEERPIYGSLLDNVLKPAEQQVWLTQVLASGGGASYEVTLTLPAPALINGIICRPSHEQEVALQVRTGTTWTPYDSSITGAALISGVKVTLTRTIGQAQGGQFLYTFGLAQLALYRVAYLHEAVVATLPHLLSRGTARPSQLVLLATDTSPRNTSITYLATAAGRENDAPATRYFTLTPGVPAVLTTRAPNFTVVDFASLAAHGMPIRKSNPFEGDIRASLDATNNGLFVGDGQWEVSAYDYDWSSQPSHAPGPLDWDPLPPGVLPSEVEQFYTDCFRIPAEMSSYGLSGAREAQLTVSGAAIPAPNRMDALNCQGFTLEPGRSYRFRLNLFVTKAFSLTVPRQGVTPLATVMHFPPSAGEKDTLYALRAAGLYLRVYLNGKTVAASPAGMTWLLRAGWNEITVYADCSETTTPYVDPILLGLSLTPFTFPTLQQSGGQWEMDHLGAIMPTTSTEATGLFEYVDGDAMMPGTSEAADTYWGLDTDDALTPLDFFSADDYNLDADGMPARVISVARAIKEPLPRCSRFDLSYNTPILYPLRYAAEVADGDTYLYCINQRYRHGALDLVPRIAARYTYVGATDFLADSIAITATLRSEQADITPRLRGLTLRVE